jgi:hypothetical protein
LISVNDQSPGLKAGTFLLTDSEHFFETRLQPKSVKNGIGKQTGHEKTICRQLFQGQPTSQPLHF